jgi:hypothetical protein
MPGIAGTMKEWKSGSLKSSSGQKVTNQKQAVAIGLSEDRAAGNAVPPPKKKSAIASETAGKALAKRMADQSHVEGGPE